MRILLLTIILATSIYSNCQNNWGLLNYGLEYHYYEQGHIVSAQSEIAVFRNSYADAFNNPHHSINIRAGINSSTRYILSNNQASKNAIGPGLSIGYRYYVSSGYRAGYGGVYAGLRADFWHFNTSFNNSTSKMIIIQPTAEFGYKLQMRLYSYIFGVSSGPELSVKTVGEPIGTYWPTRAQLVIARKIY